VQVADEREAMRAAAAETAAEATRRAAEQQAAQQAELQAAQQAAARRAEAEARLALTAVLRLQQASLRRSSSLPSVRRTRSAAASGSCVAFARLLPRLLAQAKGGPDGYAAPLRALRAVAAAEMAVEETMDVPVEGLGVLEESIDGLGASLEEIKTRWEEITTRVCSTAGGGPPSAQPAWRVPAAAAEELQRACAAHAMLLEQLLGLDGAEVGPEAGEGTGGGAGEGSAPLCAGGARGVRALRELADEVETRLAAAAAQLGASA
jgi:colicin import membrane protein